MIEYNPFYFAGPPRTGSTWFRHSCHAAFGTNPSGPIHEPHNPFNGKLRVSTIRHPATWLMSYYFVLHPSIIHVPCIDVFRTLPTTDFDDFIRGYLDQMPGEVGRAFADYDADDYIRLEDGPEAINELLLSVGVSEDRAMRAAAIGPKNVGAYEYVWNQTLLERVLEAEAEMIERYEYELRHCHSS